RLDVSAARAAPGVKLVLTGADVVAQGIGPIPTKTQPKPRAGTQYVEHGPPVLITDRARFVGDGVAWIVAETPEQAADAAALVEMDWDDLPVAVDCVAAMRTGAAQIWPDAPNNVCFEWELGDAAAVEAAFAKAEKIVELEVRNNRIVQSPMGTR